MRFLVASLGIAFTNILISWSASAASMTGNQLAEACDVTVSASGGNRERCLAYIVGVADGTSIGSARASVYRDKQGQPQIDSSRYKNELLPCYPDGVGAIQVVDVVIKYLRENPAKRHVPAARLIVDALQDAFPCK